MAWNTWQKKTERYKEKEVIMKHFLNSILQITAILFFLSSNLYSERVHKHKLVERLEEEKSKSSGSGYVQRKPDPLSYLTEKLVQKGMKYIGKLGMEDTISLINKKPNKFRDFKSHLFIIDINGNVLAHSGNPLFAGKNMLTTKDSRGCLFIQEYIHNIQQINKINYINIVTLENYSQYIYNFVYLEKIDQNLFIGAVARP
jgi:hypothetical protein